ncbi:MAG: sugar phosphate nucleotidyltransferase, partial [Balneolaceae bacterium]
EPDRPETGYGYIRYNQEKSRSRKEHSAFPVLGFTEKPDREKAISFLDQGGYLWNSGMFVWRADSILEAFRKHQPEIWSELEKWTGESVTRSEIDRFYQNCPSVSVDYGIMEQADNVQVLPAEFGWNDVGSWRAVYDLAEKDADGNAVMNTNVTIQESQNSYISTTGKRHVALVGVENVAVVETEKGLLICDLDRVQEVKEVVERLRREEGGDEWL